MLTHLLDTDICVYAMKLRDLSLTQKLESLRGNLAISDITLFELYYGAQKYDEPQRRIEIVDSFKSRLTVIPFGTAAALIAGQLRHDLETRGETIGGYDMLIAAIALAGGLTVVTNNIREFGRVPNLKCETWLKSK